MYCAKVVLRFILLFFVLGAGLSSCAGYRFKTNENPFAAYEITTLSIPMFYNRSNLPGVVGPFTSEIKLLLSSFDGLRVYGGSDRRTDAIMVGIIESDDHIHKTLETSATRFTSGPLGESIGERPGFYVPSRTRVNLTLRLVLIKNPTAEDLEYLHMQEFSHLSAHHPRIILDHKMNLSRQFTRSIDDTLTLDSGGVVNFTKNHHAVEKSVQQMAVSASNSFRELVLNVF